MKLPDEVSTKPQRKFHGNFQRKFPWKPPIYNPEPLISAKKCNFTRRMVQTGNKKNRDWGKGTVLFSSAEKFRGYSLTRFGQFFFVFFPILEIRKSLQATHSLERRSTSKIPLKLVKNGTFCRLLVFFVLFYPKYFPKLCFFFPRKRLHVNHSLEFQGWKKKQPRKKKKPAISLTHSIFHKNLQILNFSGKKKYGTFGSQGKRGVITRVCIKSMPMNRCNLCVSLLYFVLANLGVSLVFLVAVSALFFFNLKYD